MKFNLSNPRKKDEEREHIVHHSFFEALRKKEYSSLDKCGQIYLDFTGGNLYAESQLLKHHKLLRHNIFGNPHSSNPSSQLATSLVAQARQKVIDFFKAEDYFCVFTQNASGALKIVGECYPFDERSKLVLLADNHNSVNGIREYCANKGGHYEYAPIQYEDLSIDTSKLLALLSCREECSHKLFGFPAQSNVSGVKHDLSWVKKAQDFGWDVLLDAAAFVPTSRLDLSKVQPDFVSVSFYKIFGYPTGIGCLLVKKDKFDLLEKPWFAGGTVTLASVKSHHHYLTSNHERFENGTINYLDIPAIKIGLDYIEQIGIEKITERVTGLTKYLFEKLRAIHHDSGHRVVKIFGPHDRDQTGGTLIMNFFDPNGNTYPFEWIEGHTNEKLISIRSGCFCNPGVDEVNNCLSNEELSRYFTSRDKGDYRDMIHVLGKMRGATRVSVGIATSIRDLDKFIAFVNGLRNMSISH